MQEQSLFMAVLEITDSSERAAFLDGACRGDRPLRERIERLLERHAQAGSFLEVPSSADTVPDPFLECPGTTLGPYKLLEQIGEGGFGVVFMAEQLQPIRRKVAIKVIKPGMDTRQVIARFEAERQALALMEHPNIAHVLDGGETASGRPYFVMELVRGIPITDYCDRHQLSISQRLELLVHVCHAVQHAHQKGIIHRDLKPSNVLVTLHDGTPVVKVIDFGVAKAIGQTLTDKSLFTNFGQLIGTPLYMSPEQAELSGLDVDTRTDIYALGVLTYELLTGTTPFDRARFKEIPFDEMRRIIREEEPAAPSTRISALGDTAVQVSANRRSVPDGLSRLFRGELDWIVMKCLEKDRRRRYATTQELAMDLQRYLADEPVLARPPSAAYRLRKFARRNRGAVLAACLVLVALVVGIFGLSLGLIAAQRERGEAETARREAENAQKEEVRQRRIAQNNETKALAAAAAEQAAKAAAEAREADSLAALDFLERILFGKSGPLIFGAWEKTTLRQAIEAAAPAVDKEFAKQPLVEARLRRTLGLSFLLMRDNKRAVEQLEKSLPLYAAHRGHGHPETLYTMTNLAKAYALLKRNAEAAELREKALALQKEKLRADHPQTLENLENLAEIYFRLDRPEDAVKIIDEFVRHGAPQSESNQLMLSRLLRLLYLRLRYFETTKDSAGCRATAEMCENLKHTNAVGFCNNASMRAVTAAVFRNNDPSSDAVKNEADRAMTWLQQAVAGGFSDTVRLKNHPDLDALRDRDDFKKLLADLEAHKKKS
jgi:eukaryotic-like serine/threonine-protein kinase